MDEIVGEIEEVPVNDVGDDERRNLVKGDVIDRQRRSVALNLLCIGTRK